MKLLNIFILLSAAFMPLATYARGDGAEMNNKQQYQSYQMYITVNGHVMSATMVANSSTKMLHDFLLTSNITIEMDDYGHFEKVGELPCSFPQNNEQITTTPGDLILYLGNNFSIYYDTNSWNFTRLGKIDNITQSELKSILGEESVKVTLSLVNPSDISTIESDDDNLNTEYYNLSGNRMSENTQGILVTKNGNKIKKIWK